MRFLWGTNKVIELLNPISDVWSHKIKVKGGGQPGVYNGQGPQGEGQDQ